MKKKELQLRLKARIASSSEQAQLVSRAKRMAEDPGVLLPVCTDSHDPCKEWPRLNAKLKRIAAGKKSESGLNWQSKSFLGSNLTKAFAGTLLLLHSEKSPYLAHFDLKTPEGPERVNYAKRGTAKAAVLAGVQNYHHPRYRLLAFGDQISKGYHLYSTREKLYCAGHEPGPPDAYVEDALRKTPYTVVGEKGKRSCPHPSAGRALVLLWKAADLEVRICEECVLPKHRLIASLADRIGSRHPQKEFDATVHLGIKCVGEDKCSIRSRLSPEEFVHFSGEEEEFSGKDVKLDFLEAKIDDKQFLDFGTEVALAWNLRNLRDSGKKVFVSEGKCYGKKSKEFINSLNPNEEERLALEKLVEVAEGPIVVNEGTAAKVLAEYWDDHREALVKHVAEDSKVAKSVLAGADDDEELTPSEVLKRAMKRGRYSKILGDLPDYRDLPEVAAFCDDMARVSKTEGSKGVVRHVESYHGHNVKVKAIGFAAMLAIGEGKGKEWKFTKEEREFADFLKGFVQLMFEAKGRAYHEALQSLLSASGSGERVVLKE
jgi:hypothetical protein